LGLEAGAEGALKQLGVPRLVELHHRLRGLAHRLGERDVAGAHDEPRDLARRRVDLELDLDRAALAREQVADALAPDDHRLAGLARADALTQPLDPLLLAGRRLDEHLPRRLEVEVVEQPDEPPRDPGLLGARCRRRLGQPTTSSSASPVRRRRTRPASLSASVVPAPSCSLASVALASAPSLVEPSAVDGAPPA